MSHFFGWHLPNHIWLLPSWVEEIKNGKHASEFPSAIITEAEGHILISESFPGNFGNRHEQTLNNAEWDRRYEFETKHPPKPDNDVRVEAIQRIDHLGRRAKNGSWEAARALEELAREAITHLNQCAQLNPKIFRKTFRTWPEFLHEWPVMKQKREKLSESEKMLFSKIKLGAKSLFELDPATAKWKLDDAGKISADLLDFVHGARQNYYLGWQSFWHYGSGIFPQKLKKFSDETASDWWDVAKKMLLLAYPKPHKIKEFDRLVTAPTKRKSPGRIDAAILEVLKSRFISFARNNSYQT
jgi:hypothetical protein